MQLDYDHVKIRVHISVMKHLCASLGVSVDGGYDSSSDRGRGLLLGLLSQVLTDIRGGV